MTIVRHGTIADAAALAELAATTFEATYAVENSAEDMALHLSRWFGVEQQSAELSDPAFATLLAEVDGRLAGYAQLRPGETPACVAGPRPIELWRFYVARPWQGRGVAQTLMAGVKKAAAERGAQTLWLGVWERNTRAQAFYKKSGFADVGTQVFVLGADEQTDRVMAVTL